MRAKGVKSREARMFKGIKDYILNLRLCGFNDFCMGTSSKEGIMLERIQGLLDTDYSILDKPLKERNPVIDFNNSLVCELINRLYFAIIKIEDAIGFGSKKDKEQFKSQRPKNTTRNIHDTFIKVFSQSGQNENKIEIENNEKNIA